MSFVLSEELLSARMIFRSTQTGCLAVIILSSSEAIKTDMEKGGEGERESTLKSLALVWSKRSSDTRSCSLGGLA